MNCWAPRPMASRELNRRHGGTPEGPRFFLLHRRRVWNEEQGTWVGWDRTRGQLHDLNRWLRGATETAFVPVNGAIPVAPSAVRYVITLDAATRLPRGTARRLVGTMAHPLNRPRLDLVGGRVAEGYAVLQSRVTPSLPTRRAGSLFQRVFTSPSGLNPNAFAVSDVDQDLFGEESYIGKGIYDVDVFETALGKGDTESALLSHDLLEGTFARARLVPDVEVVEEFPSRYDVASARQHRWARVDWQLLPWIFGRGPSTGGGSRSTRDSADRALAHAHPPGSNAAGARGVSRVAGRMDPAAAGHGDVDRVHRRHARDSSVASGCRQGSCRGGSASRSGGTGTRSAATSPWRCYRSRCC